MQRISPFESHQTSVTLRESSIRRIKATMLVLTRHRFEFSEQRIFSWVLKLYLQHWRGRSNKPACLRRYNVDGANYKIRPLYINKVLHAAVTERAMHTGESVSRMLDFAIRTYLPRMMEELLSGLRTSLREKSRKYWQDRYARRLNTTPIFISYKSLTELNDKNNLKWLQKTEIIPKNRLSPWQILETMQFAV